MRLKDFITDIYLDISIVLLVFSYIVSNWQGEVTEIIGVTITLFSLPFWVKARMDLGQSFSVLPVSRKLITNGLYSKIQNPMYLFGVTAIAGLMVAINNIYFSILIIPVILLQTIRAKKESEVLSKRFGTEYQSYKNKTWF